MPPRAWAASRVWLRTSRNVSVQSPLALPAISCIRVAPMATARSCARWRSWFVEARFEAGAGQAAKLCNNMILAATMIVTCEGFVLAKKLGLG